MGGFDLRAPEGGQAGEQSREGSRRTERRTGLETARLLGERRRTWR